MVFHIVRMKRPNDIYNVYIMFTEWWLFSRSQSNAEEEETESERERQRGEVRHSDTTFSACQHILQERHERILLCEPIRIKGVWKIYDKWQQFRWLTTFCRGINKAANAEHKSHRAELLTMNNGMKLNCPSCCHHVENINQIIFITSEKIKINIWKIRHTAAHRPAHIFP